MLAIALFASFTTQETPKKVFIQSIENKIERGKRASDLVIADQEVVFQHDEKEKLQAK